MSEWIKELKAGDSVIVHGQWKETLTTVDKITPTGRIKIRNTYFDQHGHSIGDGKWDYGSSLYEATPEAVEELRQKVVIKSILDAAHKIQSLTYDQAKKILEALGEEPKKG